MPTGWKDSDRRSTLPPDWAVTQLRILRRDHHRCQWIRYDTGKRCLRHATDVDHIVPNSNGGSDDDSNLQSLCPFHHQRKSSSEGGLASGRSRRATRDAATPLHPGLMTPKHKSMRATPAPADDPAPF